MRVYENDLFESGKYTRGGSFCGIVVRQNDNFIIPQHNYKQLYNYGNIKKKRITPLYAPVNKKKKRTRRRRRAAGEKGQIVDRQLSEGGSRIAARSKSIEIP